MPRSVDPANYTANYNPLTSMSTSFNMGDIAEEVLEALEAAVEALLNEVVAIIKQLTGIDLSGFASFIENLASSFNLGGITDIGGLISGIEALFSGFGSGSLLSQLIAAAGGIGTDLLAFANLFSIKNIVGLLDEGGSIIAGLLGRVPVGSLTNAQPNLLPSPAFAPNDIAPNPDWTIGTSTRSADGTGSLMTTLDGMFKACRSGSGPGDIISIGVGQTLTASIYVKNKGYSGNGSTIAPAQLQLVPFTGAAEGVPVTLDTYTPTADLDWPGHLMTGTYVVPQGITGMQLRIFVTDTGQTGTFHFDDASVTQATTAPQSWITGLEDDLSSITSGWQAIVDAIASTASGIPIVGAELSDVIEALGSFNPANILGSLGPATLGSDLESIISHLVGAFEGTPPVDGATLTDLYNAVNQGIHNTSGSDVTTFVDTTGSMPIPSWVQQIDVVPVGEGQNGEDGLIFNFFGQGGQAGKINPTTWLRGTHFDSGVTTLNYTANSNGSFTFSIPAGTATAAHTITAAAGSGTESPHFGTGYVGIGPGATNYNGKPYVGGGNQNATGAAGLGPGGGGAGGNGTFFEPGGAGAPSGGWARMLATPISGGSTGADTTAPSAPTIAFDSATNSTITITGAGSVDS